MRQEINLYHICPKEAREYFSAALGGKICLIFTAVLMIIYGIKFFQIIEENISTSTLLAREGALQEKIMSLLVKGKGQLNDNSSLASLEKLVTLKSNMLEGLSKQQIVDEKGFSPEFEAFARLITPQTWLTRIHIEGDTKSILLQGEAIDTQNALQFMTQLNSDPLFEKKPFKLGKIDNTKESKGYITFTLKSEGVT